MNQKRELTDLLNSPERSGGVRSLVGQPWDKIQTTRLNRAATEIDDPIVYTPLARAVIHLLKIGSTDKKELQEMAKEFITEKDAWEKVWEKGRFYKFYNSVVELDDDVKNNPDFKVIVNKDFIAYLRCQFSKVFGYEMERKRPVFLIGNFSVAFKISEDSIFDFYFPLAEEDHSSQDA